MRAPTGTEQSERSTPRVEPMPKGCCRVHRAWQGGARDALPVRDVVVGQFRKVRVFSVCFHVRSSLGTVTMNGTRWCAVGLLCRFVERPHQRPHLGQRKHGGGLLPRVTRGRRGAATGLDAMHRIGRVAVLHEVVLEVSFGRDRGKVYCSRVDVYHLTVGLPVFRVSGRRLAEILPDVTGPLLASREIRGRPEQAAGDLSFGASHVATVRGTCGSSPTSRQRRTSPCAPQSRLRCIPSGGAGPPL